MHAVAVILVLRLSIYPLNRGTMFEINVTRLVVASCTSH